MRKPYVNKFDSLDERLKFLEECNVLNQTQEETENLNSPISNKQTESSIYNFFTQKFPM